MKIKKDWENRSKLKIKETRELDAMHDPGLDPFGLKNNTGQLTKLEWGLSAKYIQKFWKRFLKLDIIPK